MNTIQSDLNLNSGAPLAGADRSLISPGSTTKTSFKDVLVKEASSLRPEQSFVSTVLDRVRAYSVELSSVGIKIEDLQKKLAPEFSAMIELQRSAQKIQLHTHLVTAGCDSVSQTVKRLQQMG
jgi:hypothetical protein